MQLQDIRDEVKRALGNRTDITDARYNRWINWAYLDICGFHKKRIYKPTRYHALEKDIIFTSAYYTDTLAGGVGNNYVDIPATFSSENDYYNKAVIVIGTQQRMVYDYDGTLHRLYVTPDWDTNPTGTETFELSLRYYDIHAHMGIDTDNNLFGIQQIVLLQTETPLTPKLWKEVALTGFSDIGTPSNFTRRGSNIVFDVAFDSAQTVQVFYYSLPSLLVNDTDEPIIPRYMHEVVVLGSIWRGFERLMEVERAQKAKDDYLAGMIDKYNSFEIEDTNISDGIKVKLT